MIRLVTPENPWPAIALLILVVLVACWLDRFFCPPDEFTSPELEQRVDDNTRKAA